MTDYKRGAYIAEGKTKSVYEVDGSDDLAILVSKDDLTAGNGAKHDVLPGKGMLANQTTCNVFRFLKECGISLAFVEQLTDTSFVAKRCEMILYEVVVRREAHGSYLKRHPECRKGEIFTTLIVELYLKTTGLKWGELDLPVDDPLCILSDAGPVEGARLYRPDQMIHGAEPFLTITDPPLCKLYKGALKLTEIQDAARFTFLCLEAAWALQGRRLVDMKMEFGIDIGGNILLADVITNDEWRVLDGDGGYTDKQLYRDGKPLVEVHRRYVEAAMLTNRFCLPKQQILIWCGSTKDNCDPFIHAFHEYTGKETRTDTKIIAVASSMHKDTERSIAALEYAIQASPHTVIVTNVGMSNGAGPTIAANCRVPVIAVPANWKEFPDDVWSSLRCPSDVPLTVVLEPKNAILAALTILAQQNPRLKAELRDRLEKRQREG